MMISDDYYCVLSGLAPQNIGTDEGDDFADMPNGWIKITVQRRYENPQWQLLQDIKAEQLKQMLSQIEEDQHEIVRDAIQLQIDAQYVALEDRLGQYIVTEETRYISDPSDNQAVLDECSPLFEKLELDFEDLGIEQSEKSDTVENKSEESTDNSDE